MSSNDQGRASAEAQYDRATRIANEVTALRVAWQTGERSDPTFRANCASRLDSLRALFRADAGLFDSATLAALKEISAGLQAHVVITTGDRSEPLDILRSVFGYSSFRPGQEPVIRAVLAGRDCVGIMPTGAGKSLTYQIPARILGGTTLVVSPLIALMKDQVDAMARAGIRAAFLNSSLSAEERNVRLAELHRGELELVYAAPEGLEASVGGALEGRRLSLIAVDEAHCISQWGHDFRPAYRNLSGLKGRFGGIPMLALTATATHDVAQDIARQLGMISPVEHRGSFFRKNLRLSAYKKGQGGPAVRESILKLVHARRGESGIVYCLSRKSVEATADFLTQRGIRARAYHAGLESETRTRVQDAFQNDETDVIVATVAFGMGIDKPDIRYVIHRDMPRSIEGYYQEIGRAGRDGLESECVLFYSWADVMTYERFTDDVEPEIADWQKGQTRQMYRFAESEGCRHQSLVGHFGEAIEPCDCACDACAKTDLLASMPAVSGRRRGKEPETPLFGGAVRPRRHQPTGGDRVELFMELKALRKQIADSRGVPAFYVFSDAVLNALAESRPTSPEGLLEIPGIGPKKLAAYGEAFLQILREST